MSANIYWRPVKDEKRLNVSAPSLFQDMMARAGYRLPCKVGQPDVPIIRGMAVGFGPEDMDRPNPFQQIVDLLEKYDEIELWAVY